MTIQLTSRAGPLKYRMLSGPLYAGSGNTINRTTRNNELDTTTGYWLRFIMHKETVSIFNFNLHFQFNQLTLLNNSLKLNSIDSYMSFFFYVVFTRYNQNVCQSKNRNHLAMLRV